MRFFDNHTHTNFSPDSPVTIKEAVEAALARNLAGVALTDHYDIDPALGEMEFNFNPDVQQAEIDKISFEYGLGSKERDLQLLKGIEVGLMPGKFMQTIKEFTGKYHFDTVIASLHTIDGTDPYRRTYYKGRDAWQAYSNALEQMYNLCVEFKDFDILGHYDYVARYSPYSEQERDITYKRYGDYIDAIFKYLVENGKTFEINTKTYTNHAGYIPKLDLDILRRFKELGGEALSIGSDAHGCDRLGDNFELYSQIIKGCGIKYLVYYKNRKPNYYTIK